MNKEQSGVKVSSCGSRCDFDKRAFDNGASESSPQLPHKLPQNIKLGIIHTIMELDERRGPGSGLIQLRLI